MTQNNVQTVGAGNFITEDMVRIIQRLPIEEAVRIMQGLTSGSLSQTAGNMPQTGTGQTEGNTVKIGAVEQIGKISYYPVKTGKHSVGCAFYYRVAGGERKRATVSGMNTAELDQKRLKLLEKKNREYLEMMGIQGGCENPGTENKEEQAESKPLTFGELGDEWYQWYTTYNELSFSIRDSRRDALKRLKREIGAIPVDQIDDEMVWNLMQKCSKKKDGSYYSRSYMDKFQQTLRMIMQHGVGEGYCQRVPRKVQLSKKLTVPDPNARYLNTAHVKEVRRALRDNPKYSVLADLLLMTGMRQGEALALDIDDFQVLENGEVKVYIHKALREEEQYDYRITEGAKTKGSIRTIHVPKEVYKIVKKYYEDCKASETPEQRRTRKEYGCERLVFADQNGKPFNKRSLERNFSNYLKNHGVGYNVTLHMFRHTYVSNMALKMPINMVAKLIGDSVETTTKIYQSLLEVTCKDASDYAAEMYEDLQE